MTLTSGTRLGPYEIVGPIGAGGMGEVYRAHDARLDRDVAVKILPSIFVGDPDRLRRFEHEARAAGGLNHPNILAVYDVGSLEGMPYVVSELLEGETLRMRLGRGAIGPAQTNEWAGHIARGLAAAHAKGLVHRDIKPENLFVTRDKHVKILDFGLAKPTRSDHDTPTRGFDTAPGMVLGTVEYMAPEQVRGQAVDHRSDLFAFGAVVHEMLSGAPVFARATRADSAMAILNEEPAEISGSGPLVLPLTRIAQRCLEKRPEDRFQSASDLAFALDAVSSVSGSAATPAISHAATHRTAPLMRAALVALALGATAIAGVLVGKRVGGDEPIPREAIRFTVQPPADVSLYDVPALSPNSRHLAFVTLDQQRRRQLWLRAMDSEVARLLPGAAGASYPFWSPDGNSIGFFADGQLKRVDTAGGGVLIICDALDGRGGSWNAEGSILFSPRPNSPLMRVPASGGAPQPATQLTAKEFAHRWPHFLPDGDHFLYLADAQPGGNAILRVDSLRTPGSTPVVDGTTEGQYADGLLFFVRRQVLLAQPFDLQRLAVSGEPHVVAQDVLELNSGRFAFSTTPNGGLAFLRKSNLNPLTQLTWLDRSGKPIGTVGDPARFSGPAIAPDNSRVAVTRHDEKGSDIWTFDLNQGTTTRLTNQPSIESRWPVWTPDSRKIAFTASPREDAAGNVYVAAADGTGSMSALAEGSLNLLGLDWSRDATRFLYRVIAGDENRATGLWLLATPGVATVPFRADRVGYGQAAVSPDGRWVAYSSNEAGRFDIYIESFPTPGRRVQASPGGGVQPRWRGDQTELYYLSLEGDMMATALHFGSGAKLGVPVKLFKPALQSAQSNDRRGARSIYAPPLYDVAADGRFLAAVVQEEPQSREPVTVSLHATTRPSGTAQR